MGDVHFLLRQAFKMLIQTQIVCLIGQSDPQIITILKILHRCSHKILFNFRKYFDMDRPDLLRLGFEWFFSHYSFRWLIWYKSYLFLKFWPVKVEFLILILPVAFLIDRKPLRQIVFLSCGLTTFGAFVKLFCWDRNSFWLLFIGQVNEVFCELAFQTPTCSG